MNLYVKLSIEVGEATDLGEIVMVDQMHPFIQFFGDDPGNQIAFQQWLTDAVTDLVKPHMFKMGDDYVAEKKGGGKNKPAG